MESSFGVNPRPAIVVTKSFKNMSVQNHVLAEENRQHVIERDLDSIKEQSDGPSNSSALTRDLIVEHLAWFFVFFLLFLFIVIIYLIILILCC